MLSAVINQYINIQQWKIILWSRFFEISVVDEKSDLPIFFGDRNNIDQPSRLLHHFHQLRLDLFGDIFFDL